MRKGTRLESAIRKYEKDVDFVLDDVLLRLNESIIAAMQARGISRSQLAAKMGTSKAYITRLLRGNANPTVKSLVRLGLILGAVPAVTFEVPVERPALVQMTEVSLVPEVFLRYVSYIALPPARVETTERLAPCESIRFDQGTWSTGRKESGDQQYA